GTGNDRLEGWTGADTYLFNRGDGQDVISDYDRGYNGRYERSFNQTDTLQLGAGIDETDLWFTRDGDSLKVQLIGTEDSVSVENWFAGTQYKLEVIETSDSVINTTDIEALVQAMAVFDAPSGAGEVIPQNVQEQLQPVLAASWKPV
ncbi:MAG: hypothetical protein OIF55_13350, partial [Amphritea sp.]|nr:hypothetical protein [Amphritea sp.]